MALPLWWPVPFAAAVTVGHLDIDAVSGGSTNLGVAFIQGGDGGGGGGTSNQLVAIQGDWAASWINTGQIFTWAVPGAQNGQAGAGRGPSAPATAPRTPEPLRQTGSCRPTTYRFRFDGQAAGSSREEGGHARTPGRSR